MTPEQQLTRSNVQSRCIRKYAKIKNTDIDTAFRLWCALGLAEQWADYYDIQI